MWYAVLGGALSVEEKANYLGFENSYVTVGTHCIHRLVLVFTVTMEPSLPPRIHLFKEFLVVTNTL